MSWKSVPLSSSFLVIRENHWQAFQQVAVKQFEEEMLEHLKQFFPAHYNRLGELATRQMIQDGIQRARHYGFVVKRDMGRYIDLMVVLGRDFDSSPRLPWAREILMTSQDPSSKMEQLYACAIKHAAKVV